MNLTTLPRFLIGSRKAITEIVNCRGALILGAMFVLSAGFAREYDQEDLLFAPWYVLLPMVASLCTSFILYSIVYLMAFRHSAEVVPFRKCFYRFLALYWMTAPLAWIYAIPVERMLPAADAVQVNLWLLGFVSVWRVILITRIASVLFGASFWNMFFPVMLFADGLAMAVLFLTPLPIFNVMGGIPLTRSESIILGTSLIVRFFGIITLPIWFITYGVVLTIKRRGWKQLELKDDLAACVSKPLWGLGAAMLLVWVFILPKTQPPQQLRRVTENDLQYGQMEETIRAMSKHSINDYPPNWDPPPWPGYGKNSPSLMKVLNIVMNEPTAEWVKEIYLAKFERQLRNEYSVWHIVGSMDDQEFDEFATILEGLPELHDTFKGNSRNILLGDVDDSDARKERRDLLFKNIGAKVGES